MLRQPCCEQQSNSLRICDHCCKTVPYKNPLEFELKTFQGYCKLKNGQRVYRRHPYRRFSHFVYCLQTNSSRIQVTKMLSKSQWRWDNCNAKTVICWWPIFGDINALLTVVEEEVTCPGHVMCVTQSLPKEAYSQREKGHGSDIVHFWPWQCNLLDVGPFHGQETSSASVRAHTCWQLQHLKSFGCEHCSTKVPFVCVCVCVCVCARERVRAWVGGSLNARMWACFFRSEFSMQSWQYSELVSQWPCRIHCSLCLWKRT